MLRKEHVAPYIKARENTVTVMAEVIIALVALYVMAFVYYGARAVALGAVCVLTTVVTEIVCTFLGGKKTISRNYTPVVTGLLIPLMMPAAIPYYVVIIAGVFAIFVVKYPFGGTGSNLFNPALAGFAFCAVSFPKQVFLYSLPMEKLPVIMKSLPQIMNYGTEHVLRGGGVPAYSLSDFLLGEIPGPMGATHILVLLACLVFLFLRKRIRFELIVSFFVTFVLMILMLNRLPNVSPVKMIVYELFSGMLLFAGIFALSEPVTSPKRNLAKIFYGFFTAVATVLFNYFSSFDGAVIFAILLANAFSPLFDLLAEEIVRNNHTPVTIGLEVLKFAKQIFTGKKNP